MIDLDICIGYYPALNTINTSAHDNCPIHLLKGWYLISWIKHVTLYKSLKLEIEQVINQYVCKFVECSGIKYKKQDAQMPAIFQPAMSKNVNKKCSVQQLKL